MQLIEFIRRNIRSVWALETLLLMREAPVRSWSMGELIGELRASEAVVSGVLGGFESEGLVAREPEGRYRFAPAMDCIDTLCDALAAAYRERPVVVINAIASRDSISTLADAFRWRDGSD